MYRPHAKEFQQARGDDVSQRILKKPLQAVLMENDIRQQSKHKSDMRYYTT